QNIPSHFDFLFVAITCRRPEPTVTNLHNIADEMFEKYVMDFIPDCFVCFQIFVEPFEAALSSCGNQLSKQGRAKLRWASALIGTPPRGAANISAWGDGFTPKLISGGGWDSVFKFSATDGLDSELVRGRLFGSFTGVSDFRFNFSIFIIL